MVLVILLVLALFVLQTVLPGRLRVPGPSSTGKLPEDLGNRDHATLHGGRAARGARAPHMHEALPVFIAPALMNLILSVGSTALMGAWIFFTARVLYLPLYVAGVPVVRSVAWMAGMVDLLLMAIPLFDRI